LELVTLPLFRYFAAVSTEDKLKILLEVFADDSVIGNAVVYGFVAFRPELIDPAIGAINKIKAKYFAPPEAMLHCRVLFNDAARAKSEWAHLVEDQPYFLCYDVAKAVRGIGVLCAIGFMDKLTVPERMEAVYYRGMEEEPIRVGHPLNDKQLLQYAYMSGALLFDQAVGRDHVRVWIDPDRTKIEWLGQRRQAKSIHEFIKPSGDNVGQGASLLEVADLLAYSSARVLSRDRRRGWMHFKLIHRCLAPHLQTMRLKPEWWDPMANANKLLSKS
jgi:hypothetical protein